MVFCDKCTGNNSGHKEAKMYVIIWLSWREIIKNSLIGYIVSINNIDWCRPILLFDVVHTEGLQLHYILLCSLFLPDWWNNYGMTGIIPHSSNLQIFFLYYHSSLHVHCAQFARQPWFSIFKACDKERGCALTSIYWPFTLYTKWNRCIML